MNLLRRLSVVLLFAAPGWAQTISVTPSATTFAPTGGSVTFTVVLTYPAAISAVAVQINTVPAGWSFGVVGGANPPQVIPGPGITSTFEFAYTSFPAGTAAFTFTANYPAGLAGNQVFAGINGVFRIPNLTNVAAPNLTISSSSSAVVPPSILTPPAGTALNAGESYTLTVAAAGTAPLAYLWRRDGVAVAGATNASLPLTSVTAAAAGSYVVEVTNVAGSATTAATPAVITLKAPPGPVAPTITTPPTPVTAVVGGTAFLTVAAGGTTPLTYQWRKDGTALPGANSASLVLGNIQASAAGSYTVVVTNSAGSVTSAAATVTVLPATTTTAPQITVQPAAQTTTTGTSALLTVTATGAAPLTYQWRKDGIAIPGATADRLFLTGVTATSAGSYSVVVSNAAGSATSSAANLTVRTSDGVAGTYVGNFGGNGGSFALMVRPDRTGVFVGFASAARAAIVSRSVTVASDGRFTAELPALSPLAAPPAGEPARAAQEGAYPISGVIAADGSLSGSVPALNLTYAATAAAATGPTAGVAGFYQAGLAGSSAVSYAILSPTGEAIVVAISGATADGGRGTLDASGSFAVTSISGARFNGNVRTDYVISTTYTPASGAPVVYAGANAEARSEVEKLVNISTRSRVAGGGDALVAGFVISGTAPKLVLVRAIGPSLVNFGVDGALTEARLEIFSGSTSHAISNNWDNGTGSAIDIADAAARVGAFPLSRTSRDAALLLNLNPGNYTAVVNGQSGQAGVALVEVYDATAGAIPRTQRIINIATRSRAGAGNDSLIAGFFVAGTLPKRVLVRGAGPALAQFGVTDLLTRPELAVFAGENALARNAGWGNSADVAAITTATTQAGAFAFPVGSADAALILNLAPGAYTAQLGGTGGTSGNALIEIYELP